MPGTSTSRPSLSRQRVIEAAVAVADERGVAAVSMRNVAERLGVEAMSLYHHVANKDAILDGIVDAVFGEIELPEPDLDWRTAMRRRATSARDTLSRHSWALGLMESRRNTGPATLRHHDAVIGNLRAAGFSIIDAVHAVSVIDSYVYGFTLQEQQLPFAASEELKDAASELVRRMPADQYPHLRETAVEQASRPDDTYADEFAFGFELILHGLERLLAGEG
ncbi:TetR/AcrR family transcriptional regulator [Nonomuraea turcica]|uniref:TetR/AcrR family transcriptional regulator n=1 Tax=Nonomuraea sp. G32 TaxID=3067274 RepID=UPI00273AA089|nr:TetR/AcrR family transcriptional regulator [Nonomuraea sp. G32]MDP4505843.1 TetR/AcrR family transcriptional regulator [Nonomuraea sp. G32]